MSENNMEFEFAPDEKVEHYYDEVCIVLTEMGFNPDEVLVTDDSNIGDFFMQCDDDDCEWKDFESSVFKRYGLRIDRSKRVWRLAERIKYGK